MRISRPTLCFGIYIIISSSFMGQVWAWARSIFGTGLLILFIFLLFLIAISILLYQNIKSGLRLKRIILISIICVAGTIFAWRQPYLPEKTHVLEFALLAYLAMRDLTKRENQQLKNVSLAFLYVTIIGCLEEGLQWILPWRYFEIRDIATDIISGLLGMIIFTLGRAKAIKGIQSLRTSSQLP